MFKNRCCAHLRHFYYIEWIESSFRFSPNIINKLHPISNMLYYLKNKQLSFKKL